MLRVLAPGSWVRILLPLPTFGGQPSGNGWLTKLRICEAPATPANVQDGQSKQRNRRMKTNMASIGNFDIAPSEPLDLNDYAKVGGAPKERKFPNKGRYTLRATDSFTEESFAPNKANTALTFAINPTIVGPTNEG